MKKFKSEISISLLTGILLVMCSVIILLVAIKAWIGVGVLIAVLLFIAHVFLSTHYCIADNTLKIRSGIVYRKDIKIEKIRKIIRTNSILSSPALSFNRIEIIYNTFDSVLVSPDNEQEFVNTIVQRNPDVDITALTKQKN